MHSKTIYRNLLLPVVLVQLLSIILCSTASAADEPGVLGNYDKTINFGIANDFNIFVFSNHEQGSVDAAGRVAVGGNAIYRNYSVGSDLPKSQTRGDLIIGGNVDIAGGMNFSGKTVVSKESTVIHYSMINNNVNPAKSVYSKENIIDFQLEKQTLTNDSLFWASLPANGTAKVQHGQLILEGTDPKLNIFTFDGTNIAGSGLSLLTINGVNIKVPAKSTVLVNVKGDNVGFGSYSIFTNGSASGPQNEQYYVWNFHEAKSLKSLSLSICGSVLAPQADWKVIGSGNVEGNFIVNSLKNEGGTLEGHNYLFKGLLPVNPGKRLLLISIDGMHEKDLSNYIENNPKSTLAYLRNRGIMYKNAYTGGPSDAFPGILSLVTGGSPHSTGVFYQDSYDRKLLPPTAANIGDTPGTRVLYNEFIDLDPTKLDGGGTINENHLPRNPDTKSPVYPHDFLKVNTVFEVVKANRCYTAWSDMNLSYEIVHGPSGKGVDDLYTPEIAAFTNATTDIEAAKKYDDLKVEAVINQINGKDHTGMNPAPIPTLFGLSFQAVSTAQKLPGNGYIDVSGTLSTGLQDAFKHTDESLGRIVEEMKKQKIFDSTVIIISAKHGQSPIDPLKLKIVEQEKILEGVAPELIAKVTIDDVALIWLKDQVNTDSVLAAIHNNSEKAGIKDVLSYRSNEPKWPFGNPSQDSRIPDIIIQPNEGVIYSTPDKEIADHGGFTEDDTHVGLLVSYAGIKYARVNTSMVKTAQVAPTILRFLRMDPNQLQAVQKEKTPVLPGIFLTDIPAVVEAIKGEAPNQELYQIAGELYTKNNDRGFKVFAMGSLIDFSKYNNVQPMVTEGRTLVPMRAVAENLGSEVEWNSKTKLVTIKSNDYVIKLTLNSKVAYVNGQKHTLDVPAKSVKGRVVVPLRFISESFGKNVGWHPFKDVKIISICEK